MDMIKIKRCVREIITSVDSIRQIEDHKILIDTTTANIERNLNIMVDELLEADYIFKKYLEGIFSD